MLFNHVERLQHARVSKSGNTLFAFPTVQKTNTENAGDIDGVNESLWSMTKAVMGPPIQTQAGLCVGEPVYYR